MKARPIADRFWSKVAIAGPSDCWEWRASRRRTGYGAFGLPGQISIDAHRVAYALANDVDPKALQVYVRHTCDNRPCVNPAHLIAGTQADNMRDMFDRERARFPFRVRCQRGHLLAVTGIYTDRRTGHHRCAQCHRDRQADWAARQGVKA